MTGEYRVEVRRNDDGSLDEVLLYDAERCLFHMEQLDDDRWWFALYPTDPGASGMTDDDAHFDIFRRKKHVEVTER